MKVNVKDLKALNRSHGVGFSQAKVLLDRAGGDLEQAGRLAEAEARNAKLQSEGGGPAEWAAREAGIRQQIREADGLRALRFLWNKDLLTPLLTLPTGPELDALVDGICQELESSAPDFERPAPKPWHAVFLRGVPDVRLRLFHALSLKESRRVLEESLGLLAQTGDQLRSLSVNLFPSSAELLSRMPLPLLRELHLQAPFGDLSAVASASWFSQIQTLGISMIYNSGQGQHPDAKELLKTRVLKEVLSKAPALRRLSLRGFEIGELDLRRTQLSEVNFSGCVVQEPDFPETLKRLTLWRCVLGHFVFPAAAMAEPERVELTLCGQLVDGKFVTDAELAKDTVNLDGQRFRSCTLELGELAPVLHIMEPPAWAR